MSSPNASAVNSRLFRWRVPCPRPSARSIRTRKRTSWKRSTAPGPTSWVALGTGKQEKWMREHSSRLQATALVGVGAAFDFHAGVTPWAPAWVRHAGLEWAYRLLHEPRRLWRRNLDSPVFLARILGQSMLATKSPLIYFRNAH